jgi:hypothetical protein
MSRFSRLFAAVFLVAALAVPATLQASGPPILRSSAPDAGGMSFQSASRALDSFFRFVQQAWLDIGPGMDPSGGTTSAAPPQGSSGDIGPGMDPSGRANSPGRHVSTHRSRGN